MDFFQKHQAILEKAIHAIHDRSFFTPYPENPSPKVYGENADSEGKEKFERTLNGKFEELRQSAPEGWGGVEESPYTQQPLNIEYPLFGVSTLIARGNNAFHQWRKVDVDMRAGLLIESLERIKDRFFEIAYATMHTTGQGFMMAFQASGPHACDRALEAIAAGYEEIKRFPQQKLWEKPMGKYNLNLEKEWRPVPLGISVAIGCSTFPTWNTVPGLYASLVTGNSVIVKPHPGAVLPMAMVVAEIQKVLSDNGYDPNICQLAVDTFDDLIAKELVAHPQVKIIDYTGGTEFGNYLERLEDKRVFTEKAGINAIILDSVEDIDAVVQNLAFSICLYSSQMCTAPQNIFVPAEGIRIGEEVIPLPDFAEKLVQAVKNLVENPKAGPFVLGAIQNETTCDRIRKIDGTMGKVWLESGTIAHPIFENARTMTPCIIELGADQKKTYSKEIFGPQVFIVKTESTRHSLALVKEIATVQGSISCGAYVTDEALKEHIADEMSLAATPVSFNLTGGIYVNQNAGFSDFHVTGGNPSGNASFTNPEYVIRRFTWVGFREPVKS